MNNKVLFIGLGGAGQRHLRIFRNLMPNADFYGLRQIRKTPTLGPSFNVLKNRNLEELYNIKIYNDDSIIKSINPDLSIVSVPNSLHSYYTKLTFEANSHLLLEKPGVIDLNGKDMLQKTYLESNLIFRVGYQRKFHPFYNIFKTFINRNIENLEKIEIKASSFIPNWHPYEDFKNLYACRKELGGGILLTESHEINMIIDIFGLPEDWSHKFKNRELNIDVSDSCKSYFKYKNFSVNFDLSFYREPSEREILAKFKDGFIRFDIDKNTLYYKFFEKEQTLTVNIDSDYLFLQQAFDFLELDLVNSKIDIENELIFQQIVSD